MTTPPAPTAAYRDDDLVYVDPDQRVVVGLVEWSNSGRPKTLHVAEVENSKPEEKGRRPRRQRSYPWGTYRSMKRIYKLEGKIKIEAHLMIEQPEEYLLLI